jgi:hypothetical protein
MGLKTVKYAFPVLASLANNTLTNLTQITIALPETGTKTFRKVTAHVTMDDIITATGGTLTTKTLSLRLGAAGYTTVANANALTNSGENLSPWLSDDFTSHFTTNWTGTSMTCDFQVTINQSTGTTLGMVNVCVTLDITYEYDDAATTHIKTVRIPLNMPTGALATAATTYDTIPALDTYLPEASKVYRSIYVVVQGNEQNATTTDSTMTLRVGSANITTGNHEHALQSDRFIRYVWNLTSSYPDTAATQTWQPTSSSANRYDHLQAELVVTYEFAPGSSTRVMNSLALPLQVDSPMGGTGAGDYQRATRELFIQEPGTITTTRVAFYAFWTQITALGGLNMRIGTGAFVGYTTDRAAVLCGSNAAMVRNDSAFTLTRGRNSLNFDVYRTDTADLGWSVGGYFLVNYTSDISSQGVGAHNHTVEWGLQQRGTAAAATVYTIAATAPIIPEANYYISALGCELILQSSSTTVPSSVVVFAERLAGEGGIQWENAYLDAIQSDPEVGAFLFYAQIRNLFWRWPNDPGADRMNLETSRRWRAVLGGASANTVGWISLNLMLTYHTITYTDTTTVAGSNGGTVNLNLCRAGSGERVASASRTGNGSVTWTWYDNTEPMFVEAREGASYLGRSDNAVFPGSP